MLRDELNVRPGEWVLQNAANSALGGFVIQLARELGVRTLNVVRRRAAVPKARETGGR